MYKLLVISLSTCCVRAGFLGPTEFRTRLHATAQRTNCEEPFRSAEDKRKAIKSLQLFDGTSIVYLLHMRKAGGTAIYDFLNAVGCEKSARKQKLYIGINGSG